MPELEQILGAMTSKLPKEDLPDKETCKKISSVFSNLAATHRSQASAAKSLAELAKTVSPEQLTVILAAAVPPTLQLELLPGSISPLSVPPLPPAVTSTQAGRHDFIMYCKSHFLPDAMAMSLQKYSKRHPTRVLAAALYTSGKTLFWGENIKSWCSHNVLRNNKSTYKGHYRHQLWKWATCLQKKEGHRYGLNDSHEST